MAEYIYNKWASNINLYMPDTLTFTSVHNIPGAHASAVFTSKTSEVFKEEHNIAPIIINDKMKYIPWGGDNQMPYNIIDLIESDETMSTCQMFNAEVCYGSGLVYDTELATAQVQAQVDDFMLDNDLASYFLGVCQDFKHFGFCVSVILLNEDASRIVRIVRKQACYVRFAPADKPDVIPYILYANWRNTVSPEDIVLCKTHDGRYLVKQRQAPKQETTQTIRQVQAATASLSFPI